MAFFTTEFIRKGDDHWGVFKVTYKKGLPSYGERQLFCAFKKKRTAEKLTTILNDVMDIERKEKQKKKEIDGHANHVLENYSYDPWCY